MSRIGHNFVSRGCSKGLDYLFDSIVDSNYPMDRLEQMDQTVTGIQLDSRSVVLGDLFIAMPGGVVDGRQYIVQAINQGASAIGYESIEYDKKLGQEISNDVAMLPVANLRDSVSEIAGRFFDHPSKKIQVIGVTGTNGKTTFSYLMAQALGSLGRKCGFMGTIGNGYPHSLEKSLLTTDNAVAIQQRLAEFACEHARSVCMEVSSHGLSQSRVSGVKFDIAVFTNLSQDHLDYHPSFEKYGEEKAKLFAFEDLNLAVINTDDQFGRRLFEQHQAKKAISYGMHQADISPTKLVVGQKGIEFDVEWQGETINVKSPLIGVINVPNLLAVIACLLGSGAALESIPKVIGSLSSPPGRMEVFQMEKSTRSATTVVVDYSHTPDALERALCSLKQIAKGELTVVFGCGGDRDKGKRSQMGRIAEQFADKVIVTDDNPRTEPPEEIVEQILAGMVTAPRVIHGRKEAIESAICWGDPEGFVLVAGKGHEDYQITRDGVVELSDREIVTQAMRAMS